MGIIEQAGAMVFRGQGKDLQILLVRSRRNPSNWIFPKGHVEPGETDAEAALREAREEAGVAGTVVGPIEPDVVYPLDEDDDVRVRYYLVKFTKDVTPAELRERAWLGPREARRRLTHDAARELLDVALAHLR